MEPKLYFTMDGGMAITPVSSDLSRIILPLLFWATNTIEIFIVSLNKFISW
jgi:hypothetical protein